ncbi:MAG: hypothetical protein ACXVAE_02735 [Candidatus Limnocylindrales bacterium]
MIAFVGTELPPSAMRRINIEAWVTSAGTSVDYGGSSGGTLYDLAGAATSGD